MTTFAAPVWALRQQVADAGSKATLLALAIHADEDGVCFPGQDLIATETNQSTRQVRRQLAYLEAIGCISVTVRQDRKGHRSSNRYRLNLGTDITADKGSVHRSILSGIQPANRDSQPANADDPNRPTGTVLEDSTGRVTTSENYQLRNYQKEGTPRGASLPVASTPGNSRMTLVVTEAVSKCWQDERRQTA